MPISYKVIGRHIRDARKSAGLTQEAAANQLGLSPEHYGKVERGAVSYTHLTLPTT